MENQLNNIGNHGGRLAVRFARLGQSGDAYQQAYLVLAKYMIDLTNATIDYASLTPAIEAAERLAGGSDCDDDVKAVNDFIKKAIRFAEDGITNCGYVIKNVDAFTKGNGKEAYLKVIEDNATRLVQIMADSTKDYEQQVATVKALNDELTEMQTEVKQINRDKNKEQWQTVADELRATATVLSEVQEHIKRLNVADLKVSVGAYNFDMSDDQLAAAYAEYNQVEFIEYLRTA